MASLTGWRPTRAGIIFIVVAATLALAVFAGAWYVQQRGEQVRQQEAAEIAQQNLEDEADVPIIAEEEVVTEGEANSGSSTEGNGGQVVQNDNPNELPVTGTNEVAFLLAVAALAFAGSFYVASRRAAREL